MMDYRSRKKAQVSDILFHLLDYLLSGLTKHEALPNFSGQNLLPPFWIFTVLAKDLNPALTALSCGLDLLGAGTSLWIGTGCEPARSIRQEGWLAGSKAPPQGITRCPGLWAWAPELDSVSLGPSVGAQEMLVSGTEASQLLNRNLFTNTSPFNCPVRDAMLFLVQIVWVGLLHLFQPLLVCLSHLQKLSN